MTNAKATKRALLASVMALLLCFTMLLGTTFAWFTDTATSGINDIQSGTLDIVLEYLDGTEWKNAEGQTLNFKAADGRTDIIWEPGCTYVLPAIRVRNEGNLALKYEITINGVTGNAELLDVIEFTVNDNPIDVIKGELQPKDDSTEADTSKDFVIKGHMSETANNDYQNKKLTGIGITVYATQLAYESDSFNDQYDKDAEFYDVLATTDAELLAAIQDAAVKIIAIDGDLTYDWGGDSYENSKALLMKGKTFVGLDGNDSINFKGYGSANPIIGVTFKNITIKDETVGDNESSWEHGYLEFDSLTASNVTFACTIMLDGDNTLIGCSMTNTTPSWYGLWIEGGKTVIKNCSFDGTRAVKIHEAYGSEVASVLVDGCTFNVLTEKPGVVIGDLNADTSVTVKNSIFRYCQAGDQDKYIYESDTDVTTFTFDCSQNNTVIKAGDDVKIISNNAALKDAILNAADGDTVILAQDITVAGTAATEKLKIEKAITLDLNGKTMTTECGWGGIDAKGGCTIKNGTINHVGNTAAIKAFQVESIENVTINVTQTDGKTKGGIVIQNDPSHYVGSIKNVTINGATNGIECYHSTNSTAAIGSMENVKINATDNGILLNGAGKIGSISNCEIYGGNIGINAYLANLWHISLDIENSKISGGVSGIDIWDEAAPNTGSTITFDYDNATSFNGGTNDIKITLQEEITCTVNSTVQTVPCDIRINN